MTVRIRRLSEEPGVDEGEEGCSGVNSVWVVLKRTDLAGFSSRILRMEPGGHTAVHTHDREHVAVVIRGTCTVEGGGKFREVGEGSLITVPSNTPHRFSNPTGDRLVLLVMNLYPEAIKTVKEPPD